MKPVAHIAALLAVLTSSACDSRPVAPGTTSPGTSSPTAVSFIESSAAAGITFRHTDGSSGKYFIVETLASGVALFDFDQDGDLDIYFLNGRPLPPSTEGDRSVSNALYRQNDDGSFTDVTAEKGVSGTGFSIGCCVGDPDGDGDLDLYVTRFGSNVLYRNNGPETGFTFTDVTTEAGVGDPRFSAGAAFADFDRDGDLDLYVTNYCKVDLEKSSPCIHNGVPGYCAPGQYEPDVDSLFWNRGDGTFEDVSVATGIRGKDGKLAKWGMGIVTADFDDDGWLDVYVANDVSDNFLFRNRGDGTFENLAMELYVALSTDGLEQGSMGVDAADYDRDGRLDIVVTNYQKQLDALYHNDGQQGFSDLAMAKGLGKSCLPLVSWGTKLLDFDNDGWLDLFIANGHLEDRIAEYDESSTYLQRNQLYRNVDGNFEEVTSGAGTGLRDEVLSSRGAAFGDIDNDGDVDIVVVNSRERPSLLRNDGGNKRHWVLLELRGQGKNLFALGARVRLTAAGVTQIGEVRSGGSYVSQNDLRLHFGLGEATRVERVDVRWPTGTTKTFENLEADRLHVLQE